MTALDPAQRLVGAVLNGRFRLTRLLGAGGMGAVYEAEGLSGEGPRAIKVLHQELVREDQILRRFFIEAVTSHSLQHPNVVRVLETGTAENGTPYLVMELLQGTSLATYVKRAQALPVMQASQIAIDVLAALGAAHGRGIVHRDIKPDNVMLVSEPSGAVVAKVLDFGIAKVMDAAGGMGQRTRTGILLGTPGYMSPEQIKNSKAVDPRSDLWSVGVIFFELLTGQEPFPAENEFARLSAILGDEARPIEAIAPRLGAFGPFFRRALAKEPAHRFQSAHEMAAAIRSIQQPGSQPAPPPASAGSNVAATVVVSSYQGPYSAIVPPNLDPMPGAVSMAGGYSSPSTPPPPISNYPPAVAISRTHISPERPPGTPTIRSYAPAVEVLSGRPTRTVAIWVAAVIGILGFGLGLALGLLLAPLL